MEFIGYEPSMKVTNLDSIGGGRGARYLECIRSHDAELPLVAKAWRHKVPATFAVLIDFEANAPCASCGEDLGSDDPHAPGCPADA